MAILLTSSNPLGLRTVGSGGRTAISSYDQIKRTLLQTLGPEHAALFAEPSQRTATIVDWYTEIDVKAQPVRLIEAPAELQYRGLDRLETLLRDIEAKAVSLQKSDRQDERILGEMIRHSLDIPDEEAVFMVGEQPVLTFWGYVKDQGPPSVSPLRTLLRRRPGRMENDLAIGGTLPSFSPVDPDGGGLAPPGPNPGPGRTKSWRHAGLRVPSAILWGIFALLLLTCGVQLLRGCAVGLPRNVTGWLLNFCPASDGTGVSGALADERAQQAQYQAEYEDLIRQTALRRQACLITPGKPGEPQTTPVIPPPVVPPATTLPPTGSDGHPATPDAQEPSGPELKLPPKKDGKIDFLEGCWRAHGGLTETVSGKDTGKKLKVTICFNKDGSGSRTIRYEEDNAKCVGPVKASWDGDTLTIDVAEAPCERDHGRYQPSIDKCRQGDQGAARCDEVPKGDTKPNFTDFPFTHTDEQP